MGSYTVTDGTSLWAIPGVDRPQASGSTSVEPNLVQNGAVTATPPPQSSWSGQMAMLQPPGTLGTRQEIQTELDAIAAAVRMFFYKSPDHVMRECAAYSARLTEMAVLLHRVESQDRQYTRVRTQQVQRWIDQLDVQFKVASRLIEVQRQDIALAGGQV